MKILQIIPGLSLGGPTFSVTALTRYMSKLGNEVLLFTEEGDFPEYKDIDIRQFHAAKFPYNKQLVYSRSLLKQLKRECMDAEIIQTNSLWQYPNFVMDKARRGTKAKCVIVPRGTLSEYAMSLSSSKKKLVLALGQRYALFNADMFIATCEKEYLDIRRFGLKQPVAIIPNGLELPKLRSNIQRSQTIAFLARIHKVKGVDILLNAWHRIQSIPEFHNWDLKIAGPLDSDYAKEMQKLATDLGCQRVSFVGEIFGEEKYDFFSAASVYVLPTHTENFGITVTEALACETPVITTTGAPWKGIETHHCGIWINLSEENLRNAIICMMKKTESELLEMGKNGREWIAKEFSWQEIAEKTIKSYEWLIDPITIAKPDWIKID